MCYARTPHLSRAVRHPRRGPSCVGSLSRRRGQATAMWVAFERLKLIGDLRAAGGPSDAGRRSRRSSTDSILVHLSQPTQQTEDIQHLIVEQTLSAFRTGNRGVQGVGTAVRACRVIANGNHVFRTDGRLHRG
jgi:hypothetical protein